MKQPVLLELFPELLKLLFQLLHFRREFVNLLLQTRPSGRTSRSYALLFHKRIEINFAIEQMRKSTFLLSGLAWQSRDEGLRI